MKKINNQGKLQAWLWGNLQNAVCRALHSFIAYYAVAYSPPDDNF